MQRSFTASASIDPHQAVTIDRLGTIAEFRERCSLWVRKARIFASNLAGRTIVVPERRELDLFARMLEQHGAITIRCPMVAISDVPDAAPVVTWLRRFTTDPPDDLILMTGEGLGRLVGFARRAGLEGAFMSALAKVRKITRGPKPVRRLRSLGLQSDLAAEPPTTAGLIVSLSGENIAGRRIAIQLYPDNPNVELIDFLRRGGAIADPVLCYVYGSAAEDQLVIEVIKEMAAGRVDLIAFTSAPQVRRMLLVAKANQSEETLRQGLLRTKIAAVGPVSIAPSNDFHMKPLVNEIIAAFN